MRADQAPMWPHGLATRACRSCRQVTALLTCPGCGCSTVRVTVFNTPRGTTKSRWGLTDREAQVMEFVSTGRTNAEIAAELGTSPRTVKALASRVFMKMSASNRRHASRMWWEAEARSTERRAS